MTTEEFTNLSNKELKKLVMEVIRKSNQDQRDLMRKIEK